MPWKRQSLENQTPRPSEAPPLLKPFLIASASLPVLAPTAVWAIRKSLNLGMEIDLKTASELDLQLESICFATEDFKEGVRAFMEKRKPEFRGK
jgi:enoyl-CoA hydratase/carnithine racemase